MQILTREQYLQLVKRFRPKPNAKIVIQFSDIMQNDIPDKIASIIKEKVTILDIHKDTDRN